MSDREKAGSLGGQSHFKADKVMLWGVVVAVLGACAYLVYSQHKGQAEIERQVAERDQKRQERRAAQRRMENETPSRPSSVSEKSKSSKSASRTSRPASTQP